LPFWVGPLIGNSFPFLFHLIPPSSYLL
jgi:hypothetical protein